MIIALLAGLGALALALALALVAVRWQFAIVTVRGDSMLPALRDGDRVLVRRCRASRLRTGQLVVFREPDLDGRSQAPLPAWLTGANQENWIIKRVAAVPGDPVPAPVLGVVKHTRVVPQRTIVVLGDGAVSVDSRTFGLVPASHVLGSGTLRAAPSGSSGPSGAHPHPHPSGRGGR